MTERKSLTEQNETPEDVATLYSWANLHGAKYRDFSASRAQTREIARVRAEQSSEDVQERTQAEANAAKAAEAQGAAEEAQAAEQAQLAAEQSRLAAEEAERASQQAAEQDAQI